MGKAHSRQDRGKLLHVSKNVLLIAHVGDRIQRQFYVLKRQSPLYERVQGVSVRGDSDALMKMVPRDVVAIVDPDTTTDWVSVVGDGIVLHDQQVINLLQLVEQNQYPCIGVTNMASDRDNEIIDEVRDELNK